MSSLRALQNEFRPTLRLALPLVLAEIGWMTMGVVDTIMVGRLPNSAVAIGATGLGQSLDHPRDLDAGFLEPVVEVGNRSRHGHVIDLHQVGAPGQ